MTYIYAPEFSIGLELGALSSRSSNRTA